MRTCRAVARVEPPGTVVLCGKPAFQIRDEIPICLEHYKEWKERQYKEWKERQKK